MPMIKILTEEEKTSVVLDINLIKGKRLLTRDEITVLERNGNSSDNDWKEFYVSEVQGEFNPSLIRNSDFHGFVVLAQ